jgi:hypothetical protein
MSLRINKRTLKQREKELQDNQFVSKLLFFEVPFSEITINSQLYIMQADSRGDGIVFRPIRADVGDLGQLLVNVWDEGFAGSEYLPNDIYDEGDANSTYIPEETFEEGNAFTTY